ncbi:hypothetical protein AS156_05780 [Bradyrhizobium macuxiense]|uniref:Cytochrome c family protein n=1 Tax=Bradyrhizobium macuxiense TaxID=1755647 RepID=A0A109JUX1_9BRAD|nr:hypothetical protein [Bradyrhizobium macuxiense]KWV55561.1 hypothetical protein AS156_05780 [Bradyrhizobium macuxiense]
MKTLLSAIVLPPLIALAIVASPLRPFAQTQPPYEPRAEFCVGGKSNTLCSKLPAYIGPDSRLGQTVGYNGLYGQPPRSAAEDVQTPFDNMAWQMFVALNWAANSVEKPAAVGLTTPGPRVWQTYLKVSALFGNSKVRAGCTQALALPTFYIGSDGHGKPAPNNEEYLQASTNLPLIDVNGNWTLFERRVNTIEAAYLRAPQGLSSQTLTTRDGQLNFIKNNPKGAEFAASASVPDGKNGSIEIKAAWRILDPAKDDASKYFTQNILLAVSGDLVSNGRPFCRSEKVGLVGMHILQRNPFVETNKALLAQWIWATFEHVDNAPQAATPCNVSNGCGSAQSPTYWINKPSCGPAAVASGAHYSFYDPSKSGLGTNIAPQGLLGTKTQFPWNPTRPYAQGWTSKATAVPQATRCWRIYPTTTVLNEQWRMALGSLKSVFQNYILVGTQWGGQLEPPTPPNPVPANAVPGMLSNLTLETYIQNYTGSDSSLPGPGSCVSCHNFATLVDNKTSANFSFLPALVDPVAARSKMKTAQ